MHCAEYRKIKCSLVKVVIRWNGSIQTAGLKVQYLRIVLIVLIKH